MSRHKPDAPNGEVGHRGPVEGLTLSVIVPVLNGAKVLPHCLGALRASLLSRDRWELIVVDDASSDESSAVAARYADRVLELGGPPRGPAFARNRGSEVAAGDCLVFVDADVCVHPDALDRLREIFERESDVAAAFGAYDMSPPSRGLISQYRNLLHHYVHARGRGDAETFWAGLGAVRRAEFNAVGGFDAHRYPRPQIEDIELGYRLRALGHRIVLRPDVSGTHLKHWTFRNMIATDVRDRGVPWMRLLLERGRPEARGTLNLQTQEKAYTASVALAGVAAVVALVAHSRAWAVGAVLCFGVMLVGNWPLLAWFARQRGWAFAVRVIPLRVLYYGLNAVSVGLALIGSLRSRSLAAVGRMAT